MKESSLEYHFNRLKDITTELTLEQLKQVNKENPQLCKAIIEEMESKYFYKREYERLREEKNNYRKNIDKALDMIDKEQTKLRDTLVYAGLDRGPNFYNES